MTTTIPSFGRDMNSRLRLRLVDEHLRQPVIEILTQMGPLTARELEYFLRRRYDIVLEGGTTAGEMARDLVAGKHIKTRVPKDGTWDHNSVYYMSGDEQREAMLPLLHEGLTNHADAFIELYLRYKAIRENPSLATSPESLIDDLYNPKATTLQP